MFDCNIKNSFFEMYKGVSYFTNVPFGLVEVYIYIDPMFSVSTDY